MRILTDAFSSVDTQQAFGSLLDTEAVISAKE